VSDNGIAVVGNGVVSHIYCLHGIAVVGNGEVSHIYCLHGTTMH